MEAVVAPSATAAAGAALRLHLGNGARIEVLEPKRVETGWLARLARELNGGGEASGR